MTERTKQLDINHTYNGRTDNYVITLFDDGYRIYYTLISTTNTYINFEYEKSHWAEYKQCDSPFLASLIADELMKEPSVKSEIKLIESEGRTKELENDLSAERYVLNKYRRVAEILIAAGLVSEEKMNMAHLLAEKMP